MSDKSLVPADVISCERTHHLKNGITEDHVNLIGLSVEHVLSTAIAVSVCLRSDAGPSNEILASMLNSVETHLAVINELVEHAYNTRKIEGAAK